MGPRVTLSCLDFPSRARFGRARGGVAVATTLPRNHLGLTCAFPFRALPVTCRYFVPGDGLVPLRAVVGEKGPEERVGQKYPTSQGVFHRPPAQLEDLGCLVLCSWVKGRKSAKRKMHLRVGMEEEEFGCQMHSPFDPRRLISGT